MRFAFWRRNKATSVPYGAGTATGTLSCVVCYRRIGLSESVAALNERAAVALLGRLPVIPSVTDPGTTPRWFAHEECAATVASARAGQPVEDDPQCVRCGNDIDPEDLRDNPMGDSLKQLGAAFGLSASELAGPAAEVSATLYARRCDRCGVMMCHECVAVITRSGRRSATHQHCGGTFQPKPVG
jgi:hypothetical protein